LPRFSGNGYTLPARSVLANAGRLGSIGAQDPCATAIRTIPLRRAAKGVSMSDAVLTHEQAMKVLTEIITNEGFRQRYADKPAAALLEIGVPATTIANLPAACLAPQKLDPKKFESARKQLEAKAFVAAASMAIPNIRLR
jgi:putative modified peptide